MNATPKYGRGCTRWLIVLTGLLALCQAGAALRALQTPPDLITQVSLVMPLEFIASTFWAILAAWTTAALIRHRRYGVQSAARLLIGFSVYSVARLLIFTRADYERQRLPFLLVMTLLLLTVPILIALRPAANPMENIHGREPQS